MPDITGTVHHWTQTNLKRGQPVVSLVVNTKMHTGGVTRKNGEIDASGNNRSAKGPGAAGFNSITFFHTDNNKR